MNNTHHYEQLIEIFNGCFAEEFNTRLIKGDDEPIYLPADAQVPYHRIVFAHGARCMRFLTGVSPVRRAANWLTLVTGTARMDATRRPKVNLKTSR